MAQLILVQTTTASQEDAERLAELLLSARLAACVQIHGPVQSSYWWQGQIERSTEWACQVKTSANHYESVEAAILDAHPYDEPEIVATSVQFASAGYVKWAMQHLADLPG